MGKVKDLMLRDPYAPAPRSYTTKNRADASYHCVYESYLERFTLSMEHMKNLEKRGLEESFIKKAGYKSKPSNNSKVSKDALAYVDKAYNLDGIPGFYMNDKNYRSQSGLQGLLIPCRDCEGKISSLIVRTNSSKKSLGKYMAFSSNGKSMGQKVYQQTHCPIVRGKPKDLETRSIRITEGILKADVATALDEKTYCIGMHGLNVPKDLGNVIEELEVETLIIALDSGEDENTDMLQAKAKLVAFSRANGIDFKIEVWDPKLGKGIDDVLEAGHQDKIRYASGDELEDILYQAGALDPKNGEWQYVLSIEKVVNINTSQTLSKSQFADKTGFITAHAVSKLIAEGLPQVDGLTFLPNGGLFIEENGLKYLNEWDDPKIVPKEGDVQLFIDHLQYLFPCEEQLNLLIDWMAFNVQNPGQKIRWMLVIHGGQGIGKSYLGYVLKRLLGESNISSPTNEQLQEPYTPWQRACQLVIIEELMATKRIELNNKLKPIITEDMTMIREMYQAPYAYPNRFNLLAFTNHEDALFLDDKDRRYCILKSEAEAKSHEYYEQLWGWTKKIENVEALAHFFQSRDLSRFKPNGRAPETQAKRDMVEMSRPPLEQFIFNGIQDQFPPFQTGAVSIRLLKQHPGTPHNIRNHSDSKWGKVLEKCGAIKYGQPVTLKDGSKTNVWLTDDCKYTRLDYPPSAIAKLLIYDPLDPDFLNKTDDFVDEKEDPILAEVY